MCATSFTKRVDAGNLSVSITIDDYGEIMFGTILDGEEVSIPIDAKTLILCCECRELPAEVFSVIVERVRKQSKQAVPASV